MGYAGRAAGVGLAFVRSTPIGATASKLMGALPGLSSVFGPSHKQLKLASVKRAIMKGNLKKLQKMAAGSKYGRVRGLATGAITYAGQGVSGSALLSKAREYRKGAWQAYKEGSRKPTAMPGGAVLRRPSTKRRATTTRRRTTTKRRATTTRRRTTTTRRRTTTRRYGRMPIALRRYWQARARRGR